MKNILMISFLFITSFSFSQEWNYNFEEATKKAKNENKNIVIVFSGSDWCAPCMRLEKNIWQSEEFIKESKENWILVKANFPRKKANQLDEKQTELNRKLAEQYNKEGSFPLVVVLNPEGKVLGKTGFKNCKPIEYIKLMHSLEN